uniref:DUF19 domain-containing protein n=2 Tax=Caenorhabditis tropicalis TaxID=1561998 RepID=A0A1I7TJ53_9PELO
MWPIFVLMVCTQVSADINDRASKMFHEIVAKTCLNQTEKDVFDQCYHQFETSLEKKLTSGTLKTSEKETYVVTRSGMLQLDSCIGDVQCASLKRGKFIIQGVSHVFGKIIEAFACVEKGSVLERDTTCSNIWMTFAENEDQFYVLYNHRDEIFKCIDEPLRTIKECDERNRRRIADAIYTIIDVFAAFNKK